MKILSKKVKKYVKEWGIRLTAKIFRLASCEQAPIGFRLKCEPTFATQNGFSHRFPANAKRHPLGAFALAEGVGFEPTCLSANGFQDRLVMTTSISLRGYLLRRFSYFRENFARELFNFCVLENPRSPYITRIFEGTE